MRYEEALQSAIAGEAIFIIGSGFSTGAKNQLVGEDNHLWVGSQLACELAKLTEMESNVRLDIVSQEYIEMHGEKAMVDYLIKHYTVASYEDYYKAISKIKNLRVYSTNYDNLIERVCQDCGNKVKSYNIDADIRKAHKDKMVLHLNGYIGDLTDGVLPDSFKLSHLSYNNTRFFDTPWFSYLIDELYSAKAIFIIGLSFTSDLDIRRIVSKEGLKERIFFIESSDLSQKNKKFLDKYGHVILCGVKRFCEELSEVTLDEQKSNNERHLKSFRKLNKIDNVFNIQDRDIYDLFFKGIEKESIYEKDSSRNFKSLVNRDKTKDVINGIKNGKSVIIHSDLGNGKTIFVNQIVNLCADVEFYILKSIQNPNILQEISYLCNDPSPKVIICDPANVFLEILRKFSNFDLSNIRLMLVMRSSMYDSAYNNVYDVIDVMKNIDFMDPIKLDTLNADEISELDALIYKYGFYGDMSGRSERRRIEYLRDKCKSRFQNILLDLFKAMHILERLENSIKSLKAGGELQSILILTFVSSILELGLDYDDYKILLDITNAERIIKRTQNCADFLDIERGKVSVKSSIIAKEMMTSTDVFPQEEVFRVLTSVMKKLDNLYLGSDRYKNAMKNLVSCSYMSYVFGYNMESSKLIEYYENVKELNFCRKNLFFWEQYAIVCVNICQFDRAERYFKTAYSLAKNRKHGFSTYQIDNHYARYLLENQLYYRKQEGSLEVFINAHRLLNKNGEIDSSKKYSRYYKYRVARAYKEYYDTFASKYAEKDKCSFLRRCQEMYDDLKNYKKKLHEDEIREDVKECENGLKYILRSEKMDL